LPIAYLLVVLLSLALELLYLILFVLFVLLLVFVKLLSSDRFVEVSNLAQFSFLLFQGSALNIVMVILLQFLEHVLLILELLLFHLPIFSSFGSLLFSGFNILLSFF